MTELLILPVTGEAIDLSAGPKVLLDAWNQIVGAEQDLKAAKREIADEVTRRLDHEGRRSLTVDGVKFETTAPTEKVWNVKELSETLNELVDEDTISDEKAGRCIKWEPKPVWNELKTLLSDPRCQARIEHCYVEKPASRYGKITGA